MPMTETVSIQVDSTSRDKIISELNKNFFVVANAGSGKTSILVNRMVAMVEKGIDVSKICAITFTKNAAAEFLNRFQETLRKRATLKSYASQYPGDLGPVDNNTRKNCENAIKNINLCFLGTIDAFCNKILSEFPLDASIPSSSMVIEEDEEIKLYKEEYAKISRDKSSPLYDRFLDFDYFNSKSQEVFSNSIKSVIENSALDLQYSRPDRTKNVKDVINEKITKYEKAVKKDLDILLSCGSDVIDFNGNGEPADTFINNFSVFKENFNHLKEKWNGENIISIINDTKKFVEPLRFNSVPNTNIINYVGKTCKKGNKKDYALYSKDSNEFEDLVKMVNGLKYSYSIDFMYEASKSIKNELKKQGKLTFTDYLLIFRNMLIEDMNKGMHIINHIREKYSYFLIDESQDTSPFQTELFLFLNSRKKALRVEDCDPIPGSLFILGDPKQSIYRFRGADVESYLRTKDLFENIFNKNENEVLMLTKNFRSTNKLINYFNKTFDGKLKNYEVIPTTENEKDLGIGGTSGLFKYTDYIGVIKTMYKNDKYKVEVKVGNDKVERSPLFKDFMIITRSKPEHDKIIKELNKNRIPVFVEGKIDLANSNAIKSAYAVYKYLSCNNIYSSGALYNLLTSPLFNMTIDKVICKNLSTLPTDVTDYLKVIDNLKNIKDPIVLYEKILDSIKIFERIDYMNMDYAYFVLENLKKAYSNGQITTLNDAVLFIEDYINASPERIMSLDYKPDAVYLANLHKVKGLEAPIVLLFPKNYKDMPPVSRMDYEKGKSYIFSTDEHRTKSGSSYYTIQTDLYDDDKKLEKEQGKCEVERLKYVAVTRARSYLLIDPSHGERSTSFWEGLYDDTFKDFDIDSNADLKLQEESINNICKDIKVDFDNRDTYTIESPSDQGLVKVKNIYSNDVKQTSNIDARLKGTIIHRLMEMIVSSKNFSTKNSSFIDDIVKEYQIDKTLNEAVCRDILNRVYDTMLNGGYTQTGSKPKDLLKLLEKAECHCEVPFSYKKDDKVWYGSIDLLYILDGKYYIVDYKTNLEGNDLDNEYRNQLNAYKEALKEYGINVEDAYIYHIDEK